MITASAAAKPRLVRRRLLLLDYAFLALGLLSVIILALSFSKLRPGEIDALRYADYTAILLFGLAFLGKVLHANHPVGYLRAHWFAALGLLPLTHSVLIPERFYVIVQVLIVASRFGQALNRAFVGAHVMQQLAAHYKAAVVEELTEPILDHLLHVLQVNLIRGRYTASIGDGLDANRHDIQQSVEKAIHASPKLHVVAHIPGVVEAIHGVVDEALDAAIAALRSDELNHAVQETLNQSFEDLRARVRERHWKHTGVGLKDVAAGLVKGAA